MSRHLLHAFCFVLVGVLTPVSTAAASPRAQWPSQGLLVGESSGVQAWASLCADGSGGVFVSWVSASGPVSILFVQRYSASGVIHTGWPAAGLPVRNLPFQPTDGLAFLPTGFGMVSDDSEGVFLLWNDFDTEQNLEFRLIRITGLGQVASGWPADGRLVKGGATFKRDATLARDGLGGALVAYTDLEDGDAHVAVHRFTADGEIEAGWPLAGARPNQGFNGQRLPALCGDGVGGAWVGWVHDGSFPMTDRLSSIEYLTIVHHITANGSVDPAIPSGGIQVSGGEPWGLGLSLLEGAEGGAYATWVGADLQYRTGLFTQHLTLDGSPAEGWPANGIRWSMSAFEHRGRAVVADGHSGLLTSWGTWDPAAARVNTTVQRMRPDGTIPPGWDPDGIQLGPMAEYLGGPQVIADGLGGLIAAWPDSATGGGSVDVYARHVGSDGVPSPAVGQPPVSVCTAPGLQGVILCESDGAGGAFVAWADQRSDLGDIYLKRVSLADFTVGVSPAPFAGALRLGLAWPTPFRDHVAVEVEMALPGLLTAEVVDISGRRLRLIERAELGAGIHRLGWNGLDDSGRVSDAGIYWLVARTRGESSSARLLRLK